MKHIQGNRITGRFIVACNSCGANTSRQYAKKHNGCCKGCTEGTRDTSKPASREEQHARYIDCGPSAWDDRD